MSRFVKIGSGGEQLPRDASEWVAVLDTRHNCMHTKEDVSPHRVDADTADKLCADLKIAGFNDWRNPTFDEQNALVDRTRFGPAIDTAFFPNCKREAYHTSSPVAEVPTGYVWFVNFHHGSGCIGYRNHGARVRAVRSVVPASQ